MTLAVSQDETRSWLYYEANKKSRSVAFLLWFFLGACGAHRFYLRRYGSGGAMLALGLLFALGDRLDFLLLVVLAAWLIVDLFLVSDMVRRFNLALMGGLRAGPAPGSMQEAAILHQLYPPEPSWGERVLGTAAMVMAGAVILGGVLLFGAVALTAGAGALGNSLQAEFARKDGARDRSVRQASAVHAGGEAKGQRESAASGALELKVESLKRGSFGNMEGIVRVDNRTARSYAMVFVDCTFLGANGQAVENNIALITNLAPGQTGYGDAAAVTGEEIASVRCRVSQTM